MLNVNSIEHSCRGASYNQAMYWRSEPPFASKCQIRRSCHQLPIRLHLPPADVLQEERHFFWNFYVQRQRHLMVTLLHVTWGGGIIIVCHQEKVGLWQLRQAFYHSIILNISGDRQDAHAVINISTIALENGRRLALVWYWSRGQQIHSFQRTEYPSVC